MSTRLPEQSRIRLAGTSDANSLAALAARTFRDTFEKDNVPEDVESYIRESFRADRLCSELAHPDNLFLLAFLGESGPPLGYAKLRTGTMDPSVKGPHPVELERLYVDHAAIGSGVGAALMHAVLDVARRHGHQTLWLGVWERNARAIAFYKRWEFEMVGEHVFRLGSDDQTDLIMQRAL